jgi:hypothetical protein
MKPSFLLKAWYIALACFVLAGASGALLRFGLLYGFPGGLQFVNVRHAHSHFMYLGWVTPALMALIAAQLSRRVPEWGQWENGFRRIITATFILALLAFVPFLFYGYQVAEIGGRRLPLSVIASTLNVFAWYAFTVHYWRAGRSLRRDPAMRLWDASLVFLCLASLGGWGLGLSRPLQISDPFWSLTLTHLFLELFANGWFVLALLGLAYAAQPATAVKREAHWGETLMICGLPLVFLLPLPAGSLPTAVRLLAALGGLMFAAGLALNLWSLWPGAVRHKQTLWLVPLLFLGVKAVAMAIVSIPAGALWAESMALRISYLHWLLLGFITLGLVAAAGDLWGRRATAGWQPFTVTVLLLFASLIPLTRLWPLAWSGRWTFVLAAWVALGPVLAALAMLAWSGRRGAEEQGGRGAGVRGGVVTVGQGPASAVATGK